MISVPPWKAAWDWTHRHDAGDSWTSRAGVPNKRFGSHDKLFGKAFAMLAKAYLYRGMQY